MSMSPNGGSTPVSSFNRSRSRAARTAPRVWMPTSAKEPGSGFFSAISCAMRRKLRPTSSRSITTFSANPPFLASPGPVKGTVLCSPARLSAGQAAGRGRIAGCGQVAGDGCSRTGTAGLGPATDCDCRPLDRAPERDEPQPGRRIGALALGRERPDPFLTTGLPIAPIDLDPRLASVALVGDRQGDGAVWAALLAVVDRHITGPGSLVQFPGRAGIGGRAVGGTGVDRGGIGVGPA